MTSVIYSSAHTAFFSNSCLSQSNPYYSISFQPICLIQLFYMKVRLRPQNACFEIKKKDTFQNRFRLSVCTTIFNRIAGLSFYLKSFMLYINKFVLISSTNWWEAFSTFRICFRIIDRKPKNSQSNREVWILIKGQCVIYQWICLDKPYKLMGSFFFKFQIARWQSWSKSNMLYINKSPRHAL